MLNQTKYSQKPSQSTINNKVRDRSFIYRGNQLHTTSMNLRIDSDVSPDSAKPKQSQRTYKQLFKQNNKMAYVMRDSLRAMDCSLSGKKSQRDIYRDKSINKNMLLQTRQLATQRALKQTTNQLPSQRQPSMITLRQKEQLSSSTTIMASTTSIMLANSCSTNKKSSAATTATTKTQKQRQKQKQNKQMIAISEQQLKYIRQEMIKLERQNRMLRQQIKIVNNQKQKQREKQQQKQKQMGKGAFAGTKKKQTQQMYVGIGSTGVMRSTVSMAL